MLNEHHRKGLLFIVSAPSGAGKTSLVRELTKTKKDLQLSISHTTRKSRKKEKHGEDYFFISRQLFSEMENNDEFLETATVFGNKYGTSKQLIKETLDSGRSMVLDIDWQGARELKKSSYNSVSIFILPPSLKTLNERLRKRGDDPDEIKGRMQKAIQEISHYHEYDYVITNEQFEDSISILNSIVSSSFYSLNLQKDKLDQFVSEIIENQ